VNSSSDYYYLRNTLKDLLLARSVKRGDFVLSSGRRSAFSHRCGNLTPPVSTRIE